MDSVRTHLDHLIRARGEDYAALSRLIGRNPAYIQQFIRRGSPRRLAEADRKILARYLGVSESVLGGAAAPDDAAATLIAVPQLQVSASAGPGALADAEPAIAHLGFDLRWLKRLTPSPRDVSAITVRGDSMHPTLMDGDDILVDGSDAADRLRDGIYVLRAEGTLLVKRVARHPASGRISIRSDNPAYPDWEDCDPADVSLIGRVIWAGRRLV
jgi:phage repressor protein C with HTH and peptisase S24 domain